MVFAVVDLLFCVPLTGYLYTQSTPLIPEMYNDDLLMLQIVLGNMYVLMGKDSAQRKRA